MKSSITNLEFSFTSTLVASSNVIPTLPLVVLTASNISIPVPLVPDIVFLFLTIEPGTAVCSVIVPIDAE